MTLDLAKVLTDIQPALDRARQVREQAQAQRTHQMWTAYHGGADPYELTCPHCEHTGGIVEVAKGLCCGGAGDRTIMYGDVEIDVPSGCETTFPWPVESEVACGD